jgi:bacterioferritin-associated ferredoxin
MIVCSCNVLSDAQVKSVIAGAASRPRLSCVYPSLGCAARCGRCARTIKTLLEQIGHYVTTDHRPVEAIEAN